MRSTCCECLQGPWRASPLGQTSGEDQQEETSELAEIQSVPAAGPDEALDSPVSSQLLARASPLPFHEPCASECNLIEDLQKPPFGQGCFRLQGQAVLQAETLSGTMCSAPGSSLC